MSFFAGAQDDVREGSVSVRKEGVKEKVGREGNEKVTKEKKVENRNVRVETWSHKE